MKTVGAITKCHDQDGIGNSLHQRSNPFRLSTAEAEHLIDQIAEMRAPAFVITGGDPLKRPDLFDLVEYATGRGADVTDPQRHAASNARGDSGT